MSRLARFTVAALIAIGGPAFAQTTPPAAPAPAAPAAAPAAPMFATTKVTDNVYIFRYQGHQSMFVVTPAGVIATDPISLYRPQAAKTYIEEIQKITKAPIKYVIYSHHHFDHAAGGKPFKDLGAKFIAHKNAKAHLEAAKNPDVVMPDEWVGDKRVITLGGTTLELLYTGRNHSDNSLVMRLPKEKIIYAVDFLPIKGFQFRNMPDTDNPIEQEESIAKVLALDWQTLIPGHPGGGRQTGTKQDVEEQLAYLKELGAEVKKAAADNKCFDTAMKDIKLPKYESWGGYANALPANIERYCYWYARGY
jgi:glyoxylase-like metal-dependent hydrolase (beta-lactamase superfamily II)